MGIPGLLVKTQRVDCEVFFRLCNTGKVLLMFLCTCIQSNRHWIFHKKSIDMNSIEEAYIIRYFSKTYYFSWHYCLQIFFLSFLFFSFFFFFLFLGNRRKWMASNSSCFTWWALRHFCAYFLFLSTCLWCLKGQGI